MQKLSRRNFIRNTAIGTAGITAGMPAKSYARIIGANERINVAMLGCNRRFGGLAESVMFLPNADISYVCDVDLTRQRKAVEQVKKVSGTAPKGEKDLNKIIADETVDAIFVALPDHWHAPATWRGLAAGKHVYVEKPCSHNPREGEVLIDLMKRYPKQVIQMGNQQRSAVESREIIQEIHNGVIGDPYTAIAFYSNSRGRVPAAKQVKPPSTLDWELFQGPAPRREYLDIFGDYMWHWDWDYGTAETGNNATHELDIARWALQVKYPNAVEVNAGKYHYQDDDWQMYDTMDATLYFGDKTIKWDGKSRNAYNTYGGGRGTIIYGTEGSVYVDRGGYKLFDRSGKLVRERKAEQAEGGIALGGGGGMTTAHIRNFFDTIRGKTKAHAPIDEGSVSTHMCHYANISYRAGNRKLAIDPQTGRFYDQDIMSKYWGREYAKGFAIPS